jgi:isopropylmalate/homocitrate/citramalate synthase
LRLAHKFGALTIGVNAEDASRTDLKRLLEFAQAAKDNGAARLRYSDTLGLEDPFTVREKIEIISSATRIPIEMHCHNDLGMAVAVSVAGILSAVKNGKDAFINTTINGYGERAGNCDLISLILAFKFSPFINHSCIIDENLDITKAWKLARYASHVTGIPIPLNQPGAGANIFAHESGIHVDGTLKNPRNYELFSPEDLGRGEPDCVHTGRIITIGEYSGLSGLRHVYEKLGVCFYSDSEARQVLELVQYAHIHTQKSLTPEELLFIAHHPDVAEKIVC